MTRARQELALVQPLRFAITSQGPKTDAHVYGGRSRFMTEKVLKALEETVFHGSHLADGGLSSDTAPDTLDITSRVKRMW
jgi:DNA helicase-2/ATP-dependent DNA helicase PcrA